MKIVKRILAALGILVVACAAVAAYLWLKNPNPHRPEHIENPTGVVRAEGTNLYDENGDLLVLRGVNLGNWLVQENYMSVTDVGDFDTGVFTEARALAAMRANPNLTEADIRALYDIRVQAYMTETDFANIAALGLNCVRINFGWWTFTTDGETLREDAFRYMDWALEMCDRYGLYAILDDHGAMGSQNQDQHSGDDSQFHLYDSPENRRMTVRLWEILAERYRGRSCVAGYGLLNECRRAPGQFGGRIDTDFYDELYRAIRAVDPDHMIVVGYFTFPIHGARVSRYGWQNVCLDYHIYNFQRPFTQLQCLGFYRALHNFMGAKAPVLVGEWNAWTEKRDWLDSIDWFERQGWSWCSWAYKSNSWSYAGDHRWDWIDARTVNWGVYELNMEPLDLSTATFGQIADAYRASATENATPSLVHEVYVERIAGDK